MTRTAVVLALVTLVACRQLNEPTGESIDPSPDTEISLTLLHSDGTPLDGAEVILIAAETEEFPRLHTRRSTSPNGTVQFPYALGASISVFVAHKRGASYVYVESGFLLRSTENDLVLYASAIDLQLEELPIGFDPEVLQVNCECSALAGVSVSPSGVTNWLDAAASTRFYVNPETRCRYRFSGNGLEFEVGASDYDEVITVEFPFVGAEVSVLRGAAPVVSEYVSLQASAWKPSSPVSYVNLDPGTPYPAQLWLPSGTVQFRLLGEFDIGRFMTLSSIRDVTPGVQLEFELGLYEVEVSALLVSGLPAASARLDVSGSGESLRSHLERDGAQLLYLNPGRYLVQIQAYRAPESVDAVIEVQSDMSFTFQLQPD